MQRLFANIDLAFSEPEEALLHLHKVLKEAWLTAEEEYDRYARYLDNKNANNSSNWRKALEDTEHPEHQKANEAFSQWIGEWCGSDNDGAPGGYEPWQVMENNGWQIPGIITTGIVIDIYENGEVLLANEKLIRNHMAAFRGEYLPTHDYNSWPLESDFKMYVVTVGEIKPKIVKKPE